MTLPTRDAKDASQIIHHLGCELARTHACPYRNVQASTEKTRASLGNPTTSLRTHLLLHVTRPQRGEAEGTVHEKKQLLVVNCAAI